MSQQGRRRSREKKSKLYWRSKMVKNPKVSVDPIRVSKRLAEAKSAISGNPIVAVHKKNSNVAVFSRETEIIPKFADEPTRKKKIKRGRRSFASQVPETDTSYKTLYFDSQKKVEDLTKENHKLAIDLSYRSGQVDAYEYVIGNMKNVAAFSSTMRATGGDMNMSAPNAPSLNLNHLG